MTVVVDVLWVSIVMMVLLSFARIVLLRRMHEFQRTFRYAMMGMTYSALLIVCHCVTVCNGIASVCMSIVCTCSVRVYRPSSWDRHVPIVRTYPVAALARSNVV